MTAQIKAALLGLLLLLAFGAGWMANGWRADAQVAHLQLKQTAQELQTSRQAVQDIAGFHKGFNDALSNFQQTQQANAQAQQDLGRVLLDLRSTSAGLRSDFAKLPDRIASVAQPASLSTPTPAQPYSKQWQQEVSAWQNEVQSSQQKLMATQLMR